MDGCRSDPPRGRPQILGGARRQGEMTDQGMADSQRRADGMVRNAPPTNCSEPLARILVLLRCLSTGDSLRAERVEAADLLFAALVRTRRPCRRVQTPEAENTADAGSPSLRP